MAFPSSPEVLETVPIILSLVLIEGLLSVDNSLTIAAMAGRLPVEQRARALNWGMAGAYGFRCLCLFFAAVILENRWLRLLGALYLVYLMCRELTSENELPRVDERPPLPPEPRAARSFFSVVAGILFLDASLSLDNIVAAVAMTPKLWAVYVGVGIGILALRFVSGYCLRLIERFPILEKAAFLLVGFVGALLLAEMYLDFQPGPLGKFAGLVALIAGCLAYDRWPVAGALLRPVVMVVGHGMRLVGSVIGWLFRPAGWAIDLITSAFRAKPAIR